MSYLETEVKEMKKAVLLHMRQKYPKDKSSLLHELHGGRVLGLLSIIQQDGYVYKKYTSDAPIFEYVIKTTVPLTSFELGLIMDSMKS